MPYSDELMNRSLASGSNRNADVITQAQNTRRGLGVFANQRNSRQQQDNRSKVRLSGAGRLASKLYNFGEELYNLSGFNDVDYEALMSVTPFLKNTVDRDRASLKEVVPAAWDFLKSLPAGMASAGFQGIPKMYGGVSGENVTIADQNGYVDAAAQEDFDLGDQAAMFIDGAIDSAGLVLGGTGSVIRTAENIARPVKATAAAAANVSKTGQKLSRLRKAYDTITNLDADIATTVPGKIAWDSGEEAVEEFVQQQMSGIYEGGGEWSGENSVWNPDNGYLGQSAGAAYLGALGGAVMGGSMQGLNYLNENYSQTRKNNRNLTNNHDVPESITHPEFNANNDQLPERWASAFNDMEPETKKSTGVSTPRLIQASDKIPLNGAEPTLGWVLAACTVSNDYSANSSAGHMASRFGFDATNPINVQNFISVMTGAANADEALAALDPGASIDVHNPIELATWLEGRAAAARMGNAADTSRQGGKIVMGKYPSSNDAPFMFDIVRILPTYDNHIGFNPVMVKPFNADFDGDTVWAVTDPSIHDWKEARYPSQSLYKSAASYWTEDADENPIKTPEQANYIGTAPIFDFDFAYLNTTDADAVFSIAVVNAIRSESARQFSGAQIDEIIIDLNDEIDSLAEEYKAALSTSNKDEMAKNVTDVLASLRSMLSSDPRLSSVNGLVDSIFSETFASLQVTDFTQASLSQAQQNALAGIQVLVEDVDRINAENVDRKNAQLTLEAAEGHFADLLSYYTYLFDYRGLPKQAFRSPQSLVLSFKRTDDVTFGDETERTITVPNDAWELLFVMNAQLSDFGEMPIQAIEGARKRMIIDSSYDLSAARPMFSTIEEMDDFINGAFRESLQEQNENYNNALKTTTIGGEQKLFLSQKKKTEYKEGEEDLYYEFFDIFGDIAADAFIEERLLQEKGLEGISVKELIDLAVAKDGVIKGSDYFVGQSEEYKAANFFVRKMRGALEARSRKYSHKIDSTIEALYNGRPKTHDFGGSVSAEDSYFMTRGQEFVNGVAFVVGREDCQNIHFGDLNHMRGYGLYEELVGAKSIDQFKDTLLKMILLGKYAEVIDIINAHNESTDPDERAALRIRARQILYSNYGSSSLHQMICPDINERIKAAQDNDDDINLNGTLLQVLLSNKDGAYFNAKEKFYYDLLGDKPGAPPLLVAAKINDDTEMARAGIMSDLQSANRHISIGARLEEQYISKDLDDTFAFIETMPTSQSAYQLFGDMTRDFPFEMNEEALANFGYTQMFALSNQSAEKTKSEKANQEQYKQAAGLAGAAMVPYSAEVTGGTYSVSDVSLFTQPRKFLDIFFGRDVAIISDQGYLDFEIVDQHKLWLDVFGIDLKGKEPSNEQMKFVLKQFPVIQTYLVPGTIQTFDTADGSVSSEASTSTLSSWTRHYVSLQDQGLNEARLKQKITEEFASDERLFGFFIPMINNLLKDIGGYGDDPHIENMYRPEEFSKAFIAAYNRFIDITYNKVVHAIKTGKASQGSFNLQDLLQEELKSAQVSIGERLEESAETIGRSFFLGNIESALIGYGSVLDDALDNSVTTGFFLISSVLKMFGESIGTDGKYDAAVIQAKQAVIQEIRNEAKQRKDRLDSQKQATEDARIYQYVQIVCDEILSSYTRQLEQVNKRRGVVLSDIPDEMTILTTVAANEQMLDEGVLTTQVLTSLLDGLDAACKNPSIRPYIAAAWAVKKIGPKSTQVQSDAFDTLSDTLSAASTSASQLVSSLPADRKQLYQNSLEAQFDSLKEMLTFVHTGRVTESSEFGQALSELFDIDSSWITAGESVEDIKKDSRITARFKNVNQYPELTDANLKDLASNKYRSKGFDDNIDDGPVLERGADGKYRVIPGRESAMAEYLEYLIVEKTLADTQRNSVYTVNGGAYSSSQAIMDDFVDGCSSLIRTSVGSESSFFDMAWHLDPDSYDSNDITYPTLDTSNGALMVAYSRSTFEGYTGSIPTLVGVEGMMQSSIMATMYLGPDSEQKCNAAPPSKLITLEQLILDGTNLIDNDEDASHVLRVPISYYSALDPNDKEDSEIQRIFHSFGTEDPDEGVFDIPYNDQTREAFWRLYQKYQSTNPMFRVGANIGVYHKQECTCTHCRRHSSPPYQGPGVSDPFYGSKDAKQFCEITAELFEFLNYCMENKLLKAKKLFKIVSNIIMNAPCPDGLKGYVLDVGDSSQIRARATSESDRLLDDITREFMGYKEGVAKYLEDIFSDELKDLHYGRSQALSIANHTTNAFSIIYKNGTHATFSLYELNDFNGDGRTRIVEALQDPNREIDRIIPISLSVQAQGNRLATNLVREANASNVPLTGDRLSEISNSLMIHYQDMTSLVDDQGNLDEERMISEGHVRASNLVSRLMPRSRQTSLYPTVDNSQTRWQRWQRGIANIGTSSGVTPSNTHILLSLGKDTEKKEFQDVDDRAAKRGALTFWREVITGIDFNNPDSTRNKFTGAMAGSNIAASKSTSKKRKRDLDKDELGLGLDISEKQQITTIYADESAGESVSDNGKRLALLKQFAKHYTEAAGGKVDATPRFINGALGRGRSGKALIYRSNDSQIMTSALILVDDKASVKNAVKNCLATGQHIWIPESIMEKYADDTDVFPVFPTTIAKRGNNGLYFIDMDDYIEAIRSADMKSFRTNSTEYDPREVFILVGGPNYKTGDSGGVLFLSTWGFHKEYYNDVDEPMKISCSDLFKQAEHTNNDAIGYAYANADDLETIKEEIEEAQRNLLDETSEITSRIASSLDIDYWLNIMSNKYRKIYLYDSILAFINSNPNSGQPAHSGTYQRGECVSIIKRIGNDGSVTYAPVFAYKTGAGAQLDMSNAGLAGGYFQCSVRSREVPKAGDLAKAVPSIHAGVKQEMYYSNGTPPKVKLGKNMNERLKAEGRSAVADGIVDGPTYEKRKISTQLLSENLYEVSRAEGYSLWREEQPDGTWQIRTSFTDKALQFIQENLSSLESGDPRVYRKLLRRLQANDFRLFSDTIEDADAREIVVTKAIQAALDTHTQLSQVLCPYRFDSSGKKVPTVISRFTHEILFPHTSWTKEELLCLYNTLNSDFCPRGNAEQVTDDHILDHNGYMLHEIAPGKFERRYTSICRLSPVHDNINHLMPGQAAYSDQAFMMGAMRKGFSKMTQDDVDRSIAVLSKHAGRTSAYRQWHLDRRDFEGPTLEGDSDAFKHYLWRGRRMGRSVTKLKEYQTLIDDRHKHQPRILQDLNRSDSDVDDTMYDPLIADLNDALGYDSSSGMGASKELLIQIYCDITGWTYSVTGDGANVIKWDVFQKVINGHIRRINETHGTEAVFQGGRVPQTTERYCMGIVDRNIAEFYVNSPTFRGNNITMEKFLEMQWKEVEKARESIAHLNKGHAEVAKRKKLFDLSQALLLQNKMYEKVNMSLLDNGVSVSDFFAYKDTILEALGANDEEVMARLRAASDRSTNCILGNKELADARRNNRYTIDEDTGVYEAAPKNPQERWISGLKNMTILSKMMSLLSPLIAIGNTIDTVVKTGLNRTLAIAAEHGIHILDFNDERINVPWDYVKRAARDPQFRRVWKLLIQSRVEGEELVEIYGLGSEQELASFLDAAEQAKNRLEKAYGKVAYFASGGEMMTTMQIENFLVDFYIRSNQRGHTWWQQSTQLDENGNPSGLTVFEELLSNPTMFLLNILDTRNGENPDFIEASQSINWALRGSMAHRNLLSVVYQNTARDHPLLQFFQETFMCKFVQYKTNQLGSLLNYIIPMSSLHYLAASWVAENGETLNRISHGLINENVGAEVQAMIAESSLREAMMMDALHMPVGWLALALFGLAAFEPPDDDDLMCNVEEWTLFGYRVGQNWWIEDTLGLALPMAAAMKAASIGKPQVKLITNGIARQCYFNPALQVGEAVRAVFEPDYVMEDYSLDAQMAAESRMGEPGRLEWLLNSLQAAGLSWATQFVMPSFWKEFYNSQQQWEVSYKRKYEENAVGQLTEAGRQGKTQYVDDYGEMALRKASRKNPMLAHILNAVTRDNTGYLASQMPRVTIYDEAEMLSMERYSLYEKGEDGKYHLRDEAEVQARALEIIGELQAHSDMEELAESGFYLDYNTKAYLSKFIWQHIQNLKDAYYAGIDEGDFDEYVLGNGNYDVGMQRLAEIKQSYWDDINYWKSFYYDKLWSEPMKRKLTTYNRYSTTYLKDQYGNYYASGYFSNVLKLSPFNAAPGTTTDPEGTAGMENGYATLSAVTGDAMFDESGNPMRALVPAEEGYLDTPDLDSWEAYDENNPDGDTNTSTSSKNSKEYPVTYGNRRGGSGGGGGGGSAYLRAPSVNLPYSRDVRIADAPRTVNPDFDYLRPSFETKGSRQAYKREDLR